MENILTLRSKTKVLDFTAKKAVFLQVLLLISALVLPSVCHVFGLPVTKFLPMHWPVLLAGLVYGYRSGLLLGISAPVISFLISGMPALSFLPVMGAELAVYGFVAGFLREKFNLNAIVSISLALTAGKFVHLFVAYFTGFGGGLAFVSAGIWAIMAQIILLPLLARKWTSK